LLKNRKILRSLLNKKKKIKFLQQEILVLTVSVLVQEKLALILTPKTGSDTKILHKQVNSAFPCPK